jgi:uncharacterized SAM-binding protein YcdF (DUF218 family)
MLFYASKIVWFVVQPSTLVAIFLLTGSVLLWRRRRKWGARLLALGIAAYVIVGFSPLGNWLLIPLEDRIPRADLSEVTPSGIIVLGGALDTVIGVERGSVSLNEAAERMTETVALARRHAQAPVIFSGGVGEILYSEITEADVARRFFADLGLEPERLNFEDRSRNTVENAELTARLVQSLPGDGFILVTSAFHMPRAAALFAAQGLRVFPWPVDYRTRGGRDATRFFPRASEGLRRVDLATKEWVGLFVTWLRGRTSSPFPSLDDPEGTARSEAGNGTGGAQAVSLAGAVRDH